MSRALLAAAVLAYVAWRAWSEANPDDAGEAS